MERTHIQERVVVAAIALMLGAAPLAAQSRSLFVYGAAGTYSSRKHLDNAGSVDVKRGLDLSGGIGIQLGDNLSIRGELDFANGDLRSPDAFAIGGTMDRAFYGAEAQIRYPIGYGFFPYVEAGAGVMTLRPKDDPDLKDSTKFAGRFGAGVAFQLPVQNVDLFAEGVTSVYGAVHDPLRPDPPGQLDLAFRTGLQFYIR